MSISIFGIILLLFFILSFIKKQTFHSTYKNVFFIYLLVSINVNVGYLFKIGNVSIGVDTFLSFVLLLMSIPFLLKKQFNKKIMKLGFYFWFAIIFGLLFLKINPYSNGIIASIDKWDAYITGDLSLDYSASFSPSLFNYIIAALRFPIILSVIFYIVKTNEWFGFLRKSFILTTIIVIYGLLEFLLKRFTNVDIVSSFIIPFFGEVEFISMSSLRLQGFCKEASQYATVLFLNSELLIFNLIYSVRLKKKIEVKYILILMLCYLIMLLSTSFSAILLLVISAISLVVFVIKNNKTKVLIFIVFLSLFICLMFNSKFNLVFVERINKIFAVLKVILNGNNYQSYETSEGARLTSILYMGKILMNKPLFGIGLGATDAHSTLAAIFANVGIIGGVVYLLMLKRFGICNNKKTILFFVLILLTMTIMGGFGYFSAIYYPCILTMFSRVTNVKRREIYENSYY